MSKYVAIINTPGYLPMDDEPPTFDTAQEAWEYLAEEREHAEDSADYADDDPEAYEYSDTLATLRYIAGDEHEHGNPREDYPTNADGTGTVYGGTPGYDGEHDLGLAYSVAIARHDDTEGN
jgi:hypothetical protein